METIRKPYAFQYDEKVIKTDSVLSREQYALYTEASGKELLSVLADDGYVMPEVQNASAERIDFNPEEIAQARAALDAQGYDTETLRVKHNHDRDSGGGIGWSQADLETGQHLYEAYGVEYMELAVNGKSRENGEIVTQHTVIADHTGTLLLQEDEQGNRGSVLTTYTDIEGTVQQVYSESVAEAEKKEAMIEMMHDVEEGKFEEEEAIAMVALGDGDEHVESSIEKLRMLQELTENDEIDEEAIKEAQITLLKKMLEGTMEGEEMRMAA